MRIEKLRLENIGPFDIINLDFPRNKNKNNAEIHVLTGSNGSGKSTILYALAASFLQGADKIYKRMKNRRFKPRGEVLFDNDQNIQFAYHSTGSASSQRISIIDPSIKMKAIDHIDGLDFFGGENPRNEKIFQYSRQSSEYDPSRKNQDIAFDFISLAYSGARSLGSYQIQSIEESSHPPFKDALSFRNSTNSSPLFQWIANVKTKEALALSRNEKNKAGKYSESIERVERAIQRIVGMDVKFFLDYEPLNVVMMINDEILDFDVIPDGLKSIVSWIADCLMKMDRIRWVDDRNVFDREFILLLDEIDIHLHPSWQRKILPAVQKLFKNAKIFVTTHSPFVAGSVGDAWIHKLDPRKGESNPVQSELTKTGKSGYDDMPG